MCLLRRIERTNRKESWKLSKQTDRQTQNVFIEKIERTNRKESWKLSKQTDRQTQNVFIEKIENTNRKECLKLMQQTDKKLFYWEVPPHPTLLHLVKSFLTEWQTCDIHHHQTANFDRKKRNIILNKTHNQTNRHTDKHRSKYIDKQIDNGDIRPQASIDRKLKKGQIYWNKHKNRHSLTA